MLLLLLWFRGDNSKGPIHLGMRHLQTQGRSREGKEWPVARPGSPADPWPARGAEAAKQGHEQGAVRGGSAEDSEGATSDLRLRQVVEGLEEEDYRQRWPQVQRPRSSDGCAGGRGAGPAPGGQGARQKAGACRCGRVFGFHSQCNGKPREGF